MRNCLIALAILTPAASQAQQVAAVGSSVRALALTGHRSMVVSARPIPVVRIPPAPALRPRNLAFSPAPVSDRDYRINPSFRADRSAHSRALDEMNAINTRRPRAFRFRPVMALTFDAADMDGPARMSGIAPDLVGIQQRP